MFCRVPITVYWARPSARLITCGRWSFRGVDRRRRAARIHALGGSGACAAAARGHCRRHPAADCPSPTVATIQAAITAAAANDVIYVCAGTCTEQLTINKPLTLLGAQFGVDARTGRTDPAVETVFDVPAEAIM